ncbi:outer membrane protein [Devosia albogilva]|uniref:Outer membrane protein n=1 Tax=Devosia albogilva TaxID=429726 RepID=A0ABW5QJH5_9HYPH
MRVATIVAGLVLATATPVVALAQSAQQLYFDPALPSDFVAPTPFEGLYAGVLLGAISARKNNFNAGGEDIRPEFGAVVGWNQPVAPGVVLGGELQATVATDISTTYMRAMALARLGFAAGDNTLIYALGGLGVVGSGAAFEVGIGAETMLTPNMALRLEAAGIGQIGSVPSGVSIPAISAMRITSGAIWQLDGAPASTTAFHHGDTTNFTGWHAGLNIGSLADPQFNFFDDYGWGWHLSRFEMGGFVGYDHAVTDQIRAGVEVQLGGNYDTSGDAGVDLLALGRLGLVATDQVLAYAAGGLGLVEGKGAYAFGGGVEYALWGQTSLRGEALVLGRMDGAPGLSGVSGPTTSKVTLGAVWRFD